MHIYSPPPPLTNSSNNITNNNRDLPPVIVDAAPPLPSSVQNEGPAADLDNNYGVLEAIPPPPPPLSPSTNNINNINMNNNSINSNNMSVSARLQSLRQSGMLVDSQVTAVSSSSSLLKNNNHINYNNGGGNKRFSIGSVLSSSRPLSSNGALDPAADLTAVIREWNVRMKRCLVDGELEKFNRVKAICDRLYQRVSSRQSGEPSAVGDADDLTALLDEGNRLLGLSSSRNSSGSTPAPLTRPSSSVSASSSRLSNLNMTGDGEIGILSDFVNICKSQPSSSSVPWSHVFEDDNNVRKKAMIQHSSILAAGHHIFFDLKACIASICGPCEETELTFTLYNSTTSRFISENYVVRLTYNGMPADEDRIGRLYTIFADLSRQDVSAASGVYLICRIVRCGRLVMNQSGTDNPMTSAGDEHKSPSVSFRRPFGFAVLDMTPILNSTDNMEAKEHLMKIYTAPNEAAWSNLYENIIAKNGAYETSSRAEMICVSIDVLKGDLSRILTAEKYSRLGVPVTQRLGFPDIILPGDVRNSIYATLVSGEFSQGRKTSAKNVECSIEVRLGDGQTLPQAIYAGNGVFPGDNFESTVFYHNNSPRWNETFRVDVPVSNFDRGTHLFFTFRHCSSNDKGDKNEKAFAFALIPLMREDETVIGDEQHTLMLYKYEKKIMSSYLNLLDPAADHGKFSVLSKDGVTIKTELCSTKLTQSVSLLKLLRWRKLDIVEMKNILKSFTFIGPVEIIKYLQDILDALFAIIQQFAVDIQDFNQFFGDRRMRSLSAADSPFHLVFSALIFVLNIVISDRRFLSFRPILDTYIQNHFTKSPVSKIWIQLMAQMLDLTSNAYDPVLAKELRSALKAWEYLFKFIVRSYLSNPMQENKFRNGIQMMFSKSASMFAGHSSSADATLIGARMLILQNLAAVITELHTTKLFEPSSLVDMASPFLKSSGPSDEKKILIESRLNTFIDLLRSSVFVDEQARIKISRITASMLKTYISNEITDLSYVSLFNRVVFHFLAAVSKLNSPLLQNHRDMFETLDSYINMFLGFMNADFKLGLDHVKKAEMAINIVASFNLLTDSEMGRYLQDHDTADVYLEKLFMALNFLIGFSEADGQILFGPVKHTWLPVIDTIQVVVLKVCAISADFMQTRYISEYPVIPSEKSGRLLKHGLWMSLIKLLVKLLSEISNLMGMIPIESNESSSSLSDIFGKGSQLLSLIWYSLRSHHSEFIVEMVEPCLELTFCSNSKVLQNASIAILVELMETYRNATSYILNSSVVTQQVVGKSAQKRVGSGFYENASKLTVVEIECIDRLDHLIMNLDKGDSHYHQWLLSMLKAKLPAGQSQAFLQSLDRFLSLTLFVRTLSAKDGETKKSFDHIPVEVTADDDDLSLLLSHLMQFTSLLDRTQIYVKYIHQLVDIQLRQGNFAEAGWALNLHADLYDWSDLEFAPLESEISFEPLITHLMPTDQEANAVMKIGKHPQLLEGLLVATDFRKFHNELIESSKRKELLYLAIIRLFSLAGHFEHALEFCDRLASEYRCTLFDYSKLALVHLVMANLSRQLTSADRFYPEYYRVAFIGKGWDQKYLGMNVGGKQFIYRAKEFEKLGEFMDRITVKYPDSKLVKNNSWPPEQGLVDSDERWLQICKVEAVADLEKFPALDDVKLRGRVPEITVGWYKHNDTKTFAFSRPVRKGSSSDEFSNLWMENYAIKVEHKFPYFLKRSEVLEIVKSETSPIENAIKNIRDKNRELETLERRYRSMVTDLSSGLANAKTNSRMSVFSRTSTGGNIPAINCNPLTMAINGAVDAPVNGGLPMYRRMFMEPLYVQRNPQHKGHVNELVQKILDQTQIINKCIKLHGEIVSNELRPLHDKIQESFLKNFKVELVQLDLV